MPRGWFGLEGAGGGRSRWEPKGRRKNNFRPSHPIFTLSSAAPQSRNPHRSLATLAVSLNRRDQIQRKSNANPGAKTGSYFFADPKDASPLPGAASTEGDHEGRKGHEALPCAPLRALRVLRGFAPPVEPTIMDARCARKRTANSEQRTAVSFQRRRPWVWWRQWGCGTAAVAFCL